MTVFAVITLLLMEAFSAESDELLESGFGRGQRARGGFKSNAALGGKGLDFISETLGFKLLEDASRSGESASRFLFLYLSLTTRARRRFRDLLSAFAVIDEIRVGVGRVVG